MVTVCCDAQHCSETLNVDSFERVGSHSSHYLLCYICGFIDKPVQYFAMLEIRSEQYVELSHRTNAAKGRYLLFP
jgi:hypothetical protein